MRALILIVLLLLPLTSAQLLHDYQNYQELEIVVMTKGDFTIIKEEGGARLENAQVVLHYFPKDDLQQTILSQEISTNPDASITKDDSITYYWNDKQLSYATYGITSTILTENTFPKITNKVSYPLTNIPSDIQEYLRPTEFIDITPEIEQQAQDIVQEQDDAYQVITDLAEWTRTNVNYTLQTLTAEAVQKSSWALENKIGVCDELTNLFISMSRSSGIPARFVSGTVYSNTNNDFGNHGWAEVWFPTYGWIPIDVTYGQYGWIDPTHVKLKDSYDSGEPAVNFQWKAYKTNLQSGELKITAEILNKKGTMPPLTTLELHPNKEEIGFGSFIPLEVVVENTQDYYLPLHLQLTKAPGVYEGQTGKNILLEPKEKETVYFIISTPNNLDTRARYTSNIEVVTSDGQTATTSLELFEEARTYDLNYALRMVHQATARSSKTPFEELVITCISTQQQYYTGDKAHIQCRITSKTRVDNVQFCMQEKCETRNFIAGETETLDFQLPLADTRNPILIAENDDHLSYTVVPLTIIQKPHVYIRDVKPNSIDYQEQQALSFIVTSDAPVKNVNLNIRGVGTVHFETLKGDGNVNIPLKGTIPVDNQLFVALTYTDEAGKTYETKSIIGVTVENIPWYGELWNWMRGIF